MGRALKEHDMRIAKFISHFIVAALLSSAASAQAPAEAPPGYLFITGWYKNAGPQRAYNSRVGAVLREHGYQRHFIGHQGENLRVLEGDWIPGRIMMIMFPSEAHSERFWWSDNYQEIRKIRAPASALDIAQVDGVPGVTPLIDGKAAYLVFYAKVTDFKTFVEQYAPYAPGIVKKYGGQFLVRSPRADTELLEGDIPNASLVVVEFPNTKAMRDFWNSDEYQSLSDIRKATGEWSVAEVTPPQKD